MLNIRTIFKTEKSNSLLANGIYVFDTPLNLTKKDIKSQVEKIFGVRVISVNTCAYDGKLKRFRGISGKTRSYKKSFVKLAPGDKIELQQDKSSSNE